MLLLLLTGICPFWVVCLCSFSSTMKIKINGIQFVVQHLKRTFQKTQQQLLFPDHLSIPPLDIQQPSIPSLICWVTFIVWPDTNVCLPLFGKDLPPVRSRLCVCSCARSCPARWLAVATTIREMEAGACTACQTVHTQVSAQLTVSTFAHIKGQRSMDGWRSFTVIASLGIACIAAKSLDTAHPTPPHPSLSSLHSPLKFHMAI